MPRYRVVEPCFIGARRRREGDVVTLNLPKGTKVSVALELVEEDDAVPGKGKGKAKAASKPHPDELDDTEATDGLDDSVI